MEDQSRGKRALRLAGASGLLAAAVLGASANVAESEEAPAKPSSYEAVASAEGFRVSFGAPGFVAVDTFVDGGGPVSQAVIDGLGNSRAVATGTADLISIGGVLRIGQVDARAKVRRSPGTEPGREANFTVNGVTIADQAVGFSDKGFTLAGTNTPLPKDNPLLQALAEAK